MEAQFHLQVAETQVDWFDLSATITTGDPDLTPEELQLLLDAEGSFVNLPGKGWRRVRVTLSPEDQQHLAELGLETGSISSEPLRLHAPSSTTPPPSVSCPRPRPPTSNGVPTRSRPA